MQKRAGIGRLVLPLVLGLISLDVAADQLDTVNVTAMRTARTVDQTLAAVEIITRDDIEKHQAKSLYELVAGLPGIDVATSGGYGKTDSLYVRGTSTGHLLVLVDGVRVGSATLGRAALEQFSLSQIERIEIVRGPRSHLYGSEAIGGVLQIFTRQTRQKSEVNAEIAVGSNQTREYSTGFSGVEGATSVNLQINRFETAGINALDDNNPDHDGYDSTSVSGSISHHFANGVQLALSAMQVQGRNEYDRFVVTSDYYSDVKQQVINGKLNYSPSEIWDLSLLIAESRDESEEFQDDVSGDEFKTKRSQYSLQNDLYITPSDLLTIGLDSFVDEVSGTKNYLEDERVTHALFMEYQAAWGLFNLSMGARYDDTEDHGDHTTGNLAAGIDWTSRLRTTFSYGTAFRQPSFNDLYYIDPWGFDGDPNLKAEKSESYELGVVGRQDWFAWDLRAYKTDIDDLIAWEPVGAVWRPRNVNTAEIKGLELKVSTNLAGWLLTGNLSLTDARDKESKNRLINRARESGRFDISRDFGATSFNATWLIQGDRFADADNTRKAKGYSTVDLGLTYRLDNNWLIKGKVKNLFDRKYQTTADYNALGSELFVAIAYQPE